MPRSSEHIRLLTNEDAPYIQHLLQTSEYVYQRFTFEELSTLLTHYPAVGLFNGTSLRSFLLSQTVRAPSAWIGGFCVSWTESRAYLSMLFTLLDRLEPLLIAKGVRYLHYSGNDIENDWLRTDLLTRGFFPYRLLYSYDKLDYSIPTEGNQEVRTRRAEASDIPVLLNIEEQCFEELWRYDSISLRDIAATHPYFVVAELNGQVVGYQFNALDGEFGYLIRIAVLPSFNGHRIGARLMAEAIRFFERERVIRIMLNTQDDNVHAHRLYEWFGFIRIAQRGFVLRKVLG
ncbi:MAG: GNAT family N-acetyltransferase [Chloroflexota bacterium]|nr:GNAT family N-acetyltransferase [Chloroflexota bacterium]